MNHYKKALPDPMPLHLKLVDGYGALVHNPLGAASGGMMFVPILGLSMNPALVGLLGACRGSGTPSSTPSWVASQTTPGLARTGDIGFRGKPYRHEHY